MVTPYVQPLDVFTGDALFAGSIGRSDFHNSDGAALLDGIMSKLMTLPDEIVVHSGHGPETSHHESKWLERKAEPPKHEEVAERHGDRGNYNDQERSIHNNGVLHALI